MSDVKHVVKIDKHYETFLKLQNQRKDQLFCDVILRVEEQNFPAHRAVLAAASDYFFKMFTIDMKEKNFKEIVIEGVTAKSMDEILNCIYTSQCSVSEESLHGILHVASLMQLTSLLEAVSEFMQSTLNARNSCFYLKLATLYSLQAVADNVNEFFLKEFPKVSVEPSFLEFSVDKIAGILSSDELVVENEQHVFDFIVSWVNQDAEQRKQDFSRLFCCVRLQYIFSFHALAKDIGKHDFVRENHVCRDMIDDALSYFIAPSIFKAEQHRHCFAPEPDSVMVIPFGRDYQSVYNSTTETWKTTLFEGLTVDTCLEDCAVAFSHPVTVLCGGKNKTNQATNLVSRFDSIRWMKMPPMIETRCGSAAVFHDGNLYVFGGETLPVSISSSFAPGQSNPADNSFSKTYEVFDEVTHQWSVTTLPWMTSCSYGAAQVVDDTIYLIGGYNPAAENQQNQSMCKIATDSTIAFRPGDNSCSLVGKLNKARASFGCATLGSHIYVMGGRGTQNLNVDGVEMMNTTEKVWTTLNSNCKIISHLGANIVPIFGYGINTAANVKDRLYFFDRDASLLSTTDGKNWKGTYFVNTLAIARGILIPFSSW